MKKVYWHIAVSVVFFSVSDAYSEKHSCSSAIETNDNETILEYCVEDKIKDSFMKFRYAQALLWKSLTRNHIDAYLMYGIHEADKKDVDLIKKVCDLMREEAEKGIGEAPLIYGTISAILLMDHPNPLSVHGKANEHRYKWYKKSADTGNLKGMYLYGLVGVNKQDFKVEDKTKAAYLFKAAELGFGPAVDMVNKIESRTKK